MLDKAFFAYYSSKNVPDCVQYLMHKSSLVCGPNIPAWRHLSSLHTLELSSENKRECLLPPPRLTFPREVEKDEAVQKTSGQKKEGKHTKLTWLRNRRRKWNPVSYAPVLLPTFIDGAVTAHRGASI